MVHISAIPADPKGLVSFKELGTSNFFETDARLNRTATLDGGSYLDSRGMSQGDRTFTIRANLTDEQSDVLWYLFETYTILRLACIAGAYDGAIRRMTIDNGRLELLFFVRERLAA